MQYKLKEREKHVHTIVCTERRKKRVGKGMDDI